jgi:cytochrome c553
MSNMPVAILFSLSLIGLAGGAWAEGDPAAGRVKADTCLGCHGIKNYKNVYPTYAVPKICGQNAQYLLDALSGYANGDRPHETMHAQAATLSDEDRQDIAAFFADTAACGKGE